MQRVLVTSVIVHSILARSCNDCHSSAQQPRRRREEVEEGGMPPWYDTAMHRGSRLSDADKQTICACAASASR